MRCFASPAEVAFLGYRLVLEALAADLLRVEAVQEVKGEVVVVVDLVELDGGEDRLPVVRGDLDDGLDVQILPFYATSRC